MTASLGWSMHLNMSDFYSFYKTHIFCFEHLIDIAAQWCLQLPPHRVVDSNPLPVSSQNLLVV